MTLSLVAQTGNYVLSGVEFNNFSVLVLATRGGLTWVTGRGSAPEYFSVFGTASYTGASDALANINGYAKHYANAGNQFFEFPV